MAPRVAAEPRLVGADATQPPPFSVPFGVPTPACPAEPTKEPDVLASDPGAAASSAKLPDATTLPDVEIVPLVPADPDVAAILAAAWAGVPVPTWVQPL